jgi:hypothetical protein
MYSLDSISRRGSMVVVVAVPGHPIYLAESFHTAEVFARNLTSSAPIALEAPAAPQHPIVEVLLQQFAHLADPI